MNQLKERSLNNDRECCCCVELAIVVVVECFDVRDVIF